MVLEITGFNCAFSAASLRSFEVVAAECEVEAVGVVFLLLEVVVLTDGNADDAQGGLGIGTRSLPSGGGGSALTGVLTGGCTGGGEADDALVDVSGVAALAGFLDPDVVEVNKSAPLITRNSMLFCFFLPRLLGGGAAEDEGLADCSVVVAVSESVVVDTVTAVVVVNLVLRLCESVDFPSCSHFAGPKTFDGTFFCAGWSADADPCPSSSLVSSSSSISSSESDSSPELSTTISFPFPLSL